MALGEFSCVCVSRQMEKGEVAVETYSLQGCLQGVHVLRPLTEKVSGVSENDVGGYYKRKKQNKKEKAAFQFLV